MDKYFHKNNPRVKSLLKYPQKIILYHFLYLLDNSFELNLKCNQISFCRNTCLKHAILSVREKVIMSREIIRNKTFCRIYRNRLLMLQIYSTALLGGGDAMEAQFQFSALRTQAAAGCSLQRRATAIGTRADMRRYIQRQYSVRWSFPNG